MTRRQTLFRQFQTIIEEGRLPCLKGEHIEAKRTLAAFDLIYGGDAVRSTEDVTAYSSGLLSDLEQDHYEESSVRLDSILDGAPYALPETVEPFDKVEVDGKGLRGVLDLSRCSSRTGDIVECGAAFRYIPPGIYIHESADGSVSDTLTKDPVYMARGYWIMEHVLHAATPEQVKPQQFIRAYEEIRAALPTEDQWLCAAAASSWGPPLIDSSNALERSPHIDPYEWTSSSLTMDRYTAVERCRGAMTMIDGVACLPLTDRAERIYSERSRIDAKATEPEYKIQRALQRSQSSSSTALTALSAKLLGLPTQPVSIQLFPRAVEASESGRALMRLMMYSPVMYEDRKRLVRGSVKERERIEGRALRAGLMMQTTVFEASPLQTFPYIWSHPYQGEVQDQQEKDTEL